VTNTSRRSIEIESGAPGPFGVLGAEGVENPDADDTEKHFGERKSLWSVAYEKSEDVSVTERGIMTNSIAVSTELGPGGSETTTYEIGDGFGSKTYEVRESVAVVRNGLFERTRRSYPYTLVIELGEK
jgi:hypothetical protein